MSPHDSIDCDDNAVGAMDVSAKRSAAEFDANEIARSDDFAHMSLERLYWIAMTTQ
jgi:hypothetical protein